MSTKTAKIIIIIAVVIIALLAGVLLFPKTTAAADAVNFPDVTDKHQNAYAILVLKDAGLLGGYSDGTFQPDKKASRAEALAMILKAAGVSSEKTAKKMPFTDVNENDWYYPMVQKGLELKKLKGYEDKTFRPAATITLPEALAMTLSFFNVDTKKVVPESTIYAGIKSDEWYARYAQYSKNQNLIEADEKGAVDMQNPLTRGQVAELMFRMRSVSQSGKAFDITKDWTTTEYLENFWKIKHPQSWEVFKGQKNSVVWKSAPSQVFFTRIWPTTARLSISVVNNPDGLTAKQFFTKTKEIYKKNYLNTRMLTSEISVGGRTAFRINMPFERKMDMYIALPDNNFLVMYGEYGDAPIGEVLKKQLDTVLLSYQYVEKPYEPPKPVLPLETRLGTLRENVLLAGKWKDTAPLFPDKKLINVDAMGIGTGPVDYFFSKEANQTVKVERSSATILNIREGETKSF